MDRSDIKRNYEIYKLAKDIKEIKEYLDFARDLFDYTLNPSQCGLLLDYINQLEDNIISIQTEKDVIHSQNLELKAQVKYYKECTNILERR